ncbi:MAG: beta-lactamase family protein [Deltaproteobacteria bacterium]|jgi:CubicO group peptidase (beta-lactamase class C family)|nr:beta-lactamase family protein [Deltaproteobacteria bacterium]
MRIKVITTYIFMFISIFFIGCATTPEWAPNLPEDVGTAGDQKLGSVLEHIRDSYDLPALGAMLIVGGEIVEAEAIGVRKLGAPAHVTPQDRWHLGSNGKAMTATLAAVFVERGDISWDTTIGEVFPERVGKIRPEYVDVSLAALLSHTGGLPSYGSLQRVPSWNSFFNNPSPITVQRQQFIEEYLALASEGPRGKYLYSNGGYIVAGAMLEKITGMSWEQLMSTEIFEPLGMSSTGFGVPGTPGQIDEPWGHMLGGFYSPIQPGVYADFPPVIGPAGLIHSTFGDYAKFIAEHLDGARGGDGLVSADMYKTLHTPRPGIRYALGWAIDNDEWAGGQALLHTGSNTRWYAWVWIAPKRDLALVSVTNSGQEPAKDGTRAALMALAKRFKATAAEGD